MKSHPAKKRYGSFFCTPVPVLVLVLVPVPVQRYLVPLPGNYQGTSNAYNHIRVLVVPLVDYSSTTSIGFVWLLSLSDRDS